MKVKILRLDKYANSKLKVNNILIESKNHVFHPLARKSDRGSFGFKKILTIVF